MIYYKNGYIYTYDIKSGIVQEFELHTRSRKERSDEETLNHTMTSFNDTINCNNQDTIEIKLTGGNKMVKINKARNKNYPSSFLHDATKDFIKDMQNEYLEHGQLKEDTSLDE